MSIMLARWREEEVGYPYIASLYHWEPYYTGIYSTVCLPGWYPSFILLAEQERWSAHRRWCILHTPCGSERNNPWVGGLCPSPGPPSCYD